MTAPCQTANGTATLAASTPANLVALCREGDWGRPNNLPAGTAFPSTWLFQSRDGGAGFQSVGHVAPNTRDLQDVASPSPSTIVTDGWAGAATTPAGVLSASFDGGHTWQTVYRAAAGGTAWSYLGFTTLTQGVAIGSSPAGPSFLLMTTDGGHHWSQVGFASGR